MLWSIVNLFTQNFFFIMLSFILRWLALFFFRDFFFSSQAFISVNELDNQQSSWETFYLDSFQLFYYMLLAKRYVNYCLYLIKSFHQVTDYTHYSGPFCCHLREEKFTWQQSFIIHHYLEQEAWSPTLNKSAWNDSQKPLTQTIDTMLIYYERKQTFISVS